jgi:hypothetical protein
MTGMNNALISSSICNLSFVKSVTDLSHPDVLGGGLQLAVMKYKATLSIKRDP